jgi:hypothetical protein
VYVLRRDPHRPSESELAALADGSLAGRRHTRVAAAVADSPELQALVEEQRRALGAVRAARASAPPELRARLTGAPAAPALPRRRPFAPALGVACVIAVALAVVLSTVSSTAPTVAQAAALALRHATATGPAGNRGALLPAVRAAGLPYPYWEDRFGWRASGMRRDNVSGRLATTVFYRRAGQRIGYTIVSGPALATPRNAQARISDGTRIAIFGVDGRTVATWLRHGHSCVLSGAGVPSEVLVRLAAWRGQGRIPY